MILFFGTRPGKQRTRILTQSICPFCEQKGSLQATEVPNYFHLFWIPLFRVQTSRFASCSHCKRTYYKEEFTAEMEQEFANFQ
ncbi:zinc-ribbon domain-containing protein [Flavobacteriaceae bacterium R33]|uniref:Zinc-ribbon domain-containing protein n=2 Tax=Poritiphilus flavus TaxID=2697053 RepID=A0A6L9EGR0_9FLAO|nr:zinc-ribbon domain-containing protein [Poritiphilus flavus]